MNVCEYLRAVYEWRKARSRGFSFGSWAEELGFKSRSFLRLVLVGKRSITESSTPLFIKGLGLKKQEAEYFEALVKFTQAPSAEAREKYAAQLLRLSPRKSEGAPLRLTDHYQFLSSHLGPRLQVLLALDDLDRSTESLARLLQEKPSRVEELLETLERIELARRRTREDGRVEWESAISTFDVEEKLGDVALQSFHRRSLDEAIRAIDMPVSIRKYQSMIVPLSPEEFAAAQVEIRAFLLAMLEKFQNGSGSGRRLYQMNLNLIPVTGPILRLGEYRPGAPVAASRDIDSGEAR